MKVMKQYLFAHQIFKKHEEQSHKQQVIPWQSSG